MRPEPIGEPMKPRRLLAFSRDASASWKFSWNRWPMASTF